MTNHEQLKEKIKNKIKNTYDWANPYLLDEFKEENPNIPEKELIDFYFTQIRAKVDSMSKEELRTLYKEQNNLTSANQNYLLVNILEEKLSDELID